MGIEIMELKELAGKCTGNEPVYCSNACPLNLDVRSMIKKVQKSAFTSAYTLYKNTVLFPQIVSAICDEPCDKVCIRNSFGGSISLKKIEQACCRYTERKNTDRFYIPKKDKKVNIIGGGLGGLGCALKLSKRGYDVELYEAENKLGGCLWEQVPSLLTAKIIEEDMESAHEEGITFHMGCKVKSLDDLRYDAVYIATGKDGCRFHLEGTLNSGSLATKREGVFMSTGNIPVNDELHSLREGILAADEVERYLKVGRMGGFSGQYKKKPTALKLNLEGVSPCAAVDCSGRDCYTQDEAIMEAQRCLLCSCDSCIQECELLAKYKKTPEKIIEDVNATLNVMEGYTTRIASRQINSCNLCGRCKQNCPNGLDFGEIFFESRRQMQKSGDIPIAYHDFWLRDMEHSMTEEAFASLTPAGGKCKYLFFPGCQLGGSDFSYVTKSYQYLEEHLGNVGILLGCCGAPAHWAGCETSYGEVAQKLRSEWNAAGRPKIITACPTCHKLLRNTSAEWDLMSIYDIMAEYGVGNNCLNNKSYVVFDSCAAREFEDMQKNIRKILVKAGINVLELKNNGRNAQCCGYGGQIHAVDRELLDKIVSNRIHEREEAYVTYCMNCRDSFASADKKVCHILDLFWGEKFETRMDRKVPDLSQRRRNRAKAKEELEALFGKEQKEIQKARLMLIIDVELIKKMDRDLILKEDVERVITYCETSSCKLLDNQSGSFIGHLQVGHMTYWVEYKPEGRGFRVLNAYCHRMSIEEKSNG